MQRRRARGAAELAGAGAPSAVGMAVLAELRQGIVVLRAQALHAQTALQHRMRGTGGAFQRTLAWNEHFLVAHFVRRRNTSNTCQETHALSDRSCLIDDTFARAAIVMALLTAVVGLEEPFRTLRMALAGRQLPAFRTRDALIPSGSRARFARQVTLGALTPIAVITKIEMENQKRLYIDAGFCQSIRLIHDDNDNRMSHPCAQDDLHSPLCSCSPS